MSEPDLVQFSRKHAGNGAWWVVGCWAALFAWAGSLHAQASLSPSSGSYAAGQAITFTMTGNASDNWSSSNDYLMLETEPSGTGWNSTTNVCQLQYGPLTNTAYLLNDNLYSWSSGTVGSNTVLSNSNCSINLAASSASHPGNGASVTLVFPATFTTAYAGNRDLYVGMFIGAWTVYYMGSITITSTPQLSAPTFTPTAGTYTSAQTVTINKPSGSTVRYTTDGVTTPSETVGTVYSSPVAVNATMTIKAIAYESGWLDSPVATAAYTITGTVSAPVFSPAGGTLHSGQTVTITTTPSSATIRYTADGSAPTETHGTVYSGPIPINTGETLRAIGYQSGWSDSSVSQATYTIAPKEYIYLGSRVVAIEN